MKAEIYQPSPRLSRYIDSYMLVDIDWRSQTEASPIWRLIPYGKASMLFLWGDKHEYSLQGASEKLLRTRQAFMVGQLTQPIWLKFTGHTRLIKIQFKSSGMHSFLPVNMEEFKNLASLDLEALWGMAVHQILDELYSATSDEDRIEKLNSFLEKRLFKESETIDYVDYTIHQMMIKNGNISIKGLENELGISTRQLERLFKTKIGLSPKEMSKIIRLNRAFSSLDADPKLSLTSLSYQIGYFDQAHFSKEFKNLSGVSPNKLLSERSKELFVTHGQCFVKQKPASLAVE